MPIAPKLVWHSAIGGFIPGCGIIHYEIEDVTRELVTKILDHEKRNSDSQV